MTTHNKSNKRSLIILLMVFILPVILAYLALKLNWFNQAVTNRGELLQPVIEATTLLASSDTKWHLLYIIPATCDLACENAIYSVKQTYTATGKESDRVSLLFIQTEFSAQFAVDKVKTFKDSIVLQKSRDNVNELFQNVGINAIFISDTLHNIVLRYPITSDKQQAIMDSRDILADLKKLLKLSRIG